METIGTRYSLHLENLCSVLLHSTRLLNPYTTPYTLKTYALFYYTT